MNYDDHLARHAAKQKELEQEHAEKMRRRAIALEECFREADEIVEGVINPELESMMQALAKHGCPARITFTREVSELSKDSTFNIGIELREDHATDLPKRGIVFMAVPHGKFFQVSLHTSKDRSIRPQLHEMKFGDVSTESVAKTCERFLQLTFPA